MRESYIEKTMKKKVEDEGGLFIKFTSPSMSGVPDRLVLLPNGVSFLAEIKSPGKKLRPLQKKVCARITELGHPVELIDSLEKIEETLDRYTKRGDPFHD